MADHDTHDHTGIPGVGGAAPTKAQAGMSGNTTTATDTIIDAAGCSVSLTAGNWLIWGVMTFDTGTAVYELAVIADSSNTQVSMGRGIRNTGTPTTLAIPPVVVSPGSTTTYKLRGQTGASGTILQYGAASVPGTTIAAIKVA